MTESTIDMKVFNELKETMGADFIAELLATFFDDAPNLIQEMKTALQSENPDTFRRAAHSMKSNCATFGAMPLSALAKELEMLGKEANLAGVDNKLEHLEVDYKQVENELKKLIG
jgi:HPt (histidine-containing phosphotransfer) domain-containing protein